MARALKTLLVLSSRMLICPEGFPLPAVRGPELCCSAPGAQPASAIAPTASPPSWKTWRREKPRLIDDDAFISLLLREVPDGGGYLVCCGVTRGCAAKVLRDGGG